MQELREAPAGVKREFRDLLRELLADKDPTRRCAVIHKLVEDAETPSYARHASTPDWLKHARRERLELLRARRRCREDHDYFAGMEQLRAA